VSIIYGSKFSDAGKLLGAYALLVPILYFWWARMRVAILENQISSEIAVSLISISSFLALFYLFPRYEIECLIWFMLGSISLGNLVMIPFSKFIRNSWIDYLKSLKHFKNILKLRKSPTL
jgi:hypothetical protein